MITFDAPLPVGFALVPGVLLGALLILPRGRWWIALAAGVPVQAALLVNGGAPRWVLALVGAVLAPLVVALVLEPDGRHREHLVPVARVLWFLFVVTVVGTAVMLVCRLAVGLDPMRRWAEALAVGVGMAVVTPTMLAWRRPAPQPRSVAEAVGVAMAVLGSCIMVFGAPPESFDITLPYLTLPPIIWAAMRFGTRGAGVATLLLGMVSSIATAAGRGSFVAAVGEHTSAVLLNQMFVLVAVVTALVIAAMAEDLRDHRQVESQLRHLAYHDTLTGLPNRAELTAALERALPRGSTSEVGLLIIDVDNFKVVNDGLGHHAGDELLVQLSDRISGCLRSGDTLARLSGDEFVAVLPGARPADTELIADRVLAAVSSPVTLGPAGEVRPSVSIGISGCGGVWPTDACTGDSLLRHADAALYEAKDLGKGRWCHFDGDLRAAVQDRLLIATDFEPALAVGQVHWLLQPEVDLRTGELFSMEALCRWDHPGAGPIPPDRFVSVLETSGQAGTLFDAALEAALRAQQTVSDQTGFRPSIAVNLSAPLLSEESLERRLLPALQRWESPAELLWLEVTESALATDRAVRTLSAVQDLGVRFAIDDFGTGWSSMARLSSFGWDALKVDRSFISRLGEDDQVQHLVEAMVAMAHALGIPVVAEGVETSAQLEWITRLGCDIAQGYLFSRPVEPVDAARSVSASGHWVGPPRNGASLTPSPTMLPVG